MCDLIMKTFIKYGWAFSVKKFPGVIQIGDYLGFHVDSLNHEISLSQKRIQKIKSFFDHFQNLEKKALPPREVARIAGWMISSSEVCKPAKYWASFFYDLLLNVKWEGPRIGIPEEAAEVFKSFIDYIGTYKHPIIEFPEIQYTVIGDAIPGTVAAVLYKGDVPYASPTSNPGVKVDAAWSQDIPPLPTIAHYEA